MKTISQKISIYVMVALFIVSACQNKPENESVEEVPNGPILLDHIHLSNLPNFENIQTIGDDTNPFIDIETIPYDQRQLNPVATLPAIDASIFDYNLNGILTPQAPFLSPNAYIEVINGNYMTGENKVNCKCGNPIGVTYIKLVVNAQSDKIYIIKTKATDISAPVNLTMFSVGLFHQARIDATNPQFEVLFSPAENGRVEMWVQCSNPNSGGNPWTFESIEIQEVDRP